MGGYNKSEVDAYILHVSKKGERERRDYEKKIEVLEAEIKKLKGEKENVESMLKEDEAIISAFHTMVAEAGGETADSQTAEKLPDEASEVLEKSKRYDEISRQLGEIIIKANADAARIISEAEAEANAIRQKAATDIKLAAENITQKLSAIANETANVLADNADAE